LVGKVVLAYSGGLDTSVIIKYLQQKYDAEVVTVTVDVGQRDDLKAIGDKANTLEVFKHYSIDAKEEFAEDYVFPSIKANGLYEEKYPISTALARPLIVSKLVEVAEKEEAQAVAHGCTGKGNDQVRFDVTIKSMAPGLKIIAPVREWDLHRDEEIKFAKENGIPIPNDLDSPYSIDQNLWGRSIECGVLEYSEREPPDEIFEWTLSPEEAPNKPEYVSIDFEEGVPCAINGEEMKPVELVDNLNGIAGRNSVGRIDHIEDRLVGIKSREVYECPAALVLLEAHKDLEKLVLTRHQLQFKRQVDNEWAFLVYTGLWMDPLKNNLDQFIESTQENVTGQVKIKMYKGSLIVVGRTSPMSLYDLNLATYNIETTFNQVHSEGFIELWGLPTKVSCQLKRKKLVKTYQKVAPKISR